MKLMNRITMRKKYGFQCANNQSSWSFVNHDKKQVLFQKEANTTLIYSRDWEGRGGKELLEHLALVDDKGYEPMLIGFECTFDVDGSRKVLGYFDRILPAQLEWSDNELHARVKR